MSRYSNSKDTCDELVANFFKKQGYEIIEKGGKGKISFDVIAKKNNIFALCEVKSDKEISAVKDFKYKSAPNIYLGNIERDLYVKKYSNLLKEQYTAKVKEIILLYIFTITHQIPSTLNYTLKINPDITKYNLYIAIPKEYDTYLKVAEQIINKETGIKSLKNKEEYSNLLIYNLNI